MLEAGEEEGTKLPLVAINVAEMVLSQQSREKFLSQILRLVRVVTASPHERVEREPVDTTQFAQCLSCLRRCVRFRRGAYKRPACRCECALGDMGCGLARRICCHAETPLSGMDASVTRMRGSTASLS